MWRKAQAIPAGQWNSQTKMPPIRLHRRNAVMAAAAAAAGMAVAYNVGAAIIAHYVQQRGQRRRRLRDDDSPPRGDRTRHRPRTKQDLDAAATTTTMSGSALLEIACFSGESALIAARAGADRIELCSDYASGGLTPSAETVASVTAQVEIPVYVMIRPHGRDFFYEEAEYAEMRATLERMKAAGAGGFVFGILRRPDADEEASPLVDVDRNRALVDLADGRPCTFHRAFDLIPEGEWERAVDDIAACGFQSILTCGGPPGKKASECIEALGRLVHRQQERREVNSEAGLVVPRIIVGGGVRSTNVSGIYRAVQADAFHSAALEGKKAYVSRGEVRRIRGAMDRVVRVRNWESSVEPWSEDASGVIE